MNEFLDANYHTHTARCGHAFGEDEEYVLHAINAGIKILGFSDHVILPDYIQPGMRGAPDLFEGYLSSINSLKEKYKDQIEIHVAFECEYMPEYVAYYSDLLQSGKVEYLIMGQHCRLIDGRMEFYGNLPGGPGAVLETARDTVKGIESGLFSYVCHPDMFMDWYRKWDDVAVQAARMICEAAAKHHVPLEINGGRHREGSVNYYFEGHYIPAYPFPFFWDIAKEFGCEVIFGCDAHHPDHLDKVDYDDMYEMAVNKGLKIVKRLKFVNKFSR